MRSSSVSVRTTIPPSVSGPASRPSTVAIETSGGNRGETRCQTNCKPLSERAAQTSTPTATSSAASAIATNANADLSSKRFIGRDPMLKCSR